MDAACGLGSYYGEAAIGAVYRIGRWDAEIEVLCFNCYICEVFKRHCIFETRSKCIACGGRFIGSAIKTIIGVTPTRIDRCEYCSALDVD